MNRMDFNIISQWIKPNSKVLDLGCGDGSLLQHLKESKNASGYGIEFKDENILKCIDNQVNVVQIDLEQGLQDFNNSSFDYVILSKTLQAVKNTEQIIDEMIRVGKEVIITFPNFGFWQQRVDIMFGKMPISDELPYEWYNSPNFHFCTVDDFERFCDHKNIKITSKIHIHEGQIVDFMPNLFSSLAIYRFTKN